jgi:membrane-associated phospholipid phosphatase
MDWTIEGSHGVYEYPGIPAVSDTLDILMRLSLLAAGFTLFALTAAHAQAQAPIHQLHADPNLQSSQNASLSSESFASAGNPTTPGASAASMPSSAPNATIQNGKPICGITHLVRCVEDLGEDDKGIFTSPLHMQPKDAYWLIPLSAATGLAFAYDTNAEQAVGVNANRTDTANTIADFGSFYATGAEGAGLYFLGLARKNPKLAETGRLGAEAVIDSGTVTLATKLVSNRQRPLEGNGQGNFWAGGASHWEWDSSFPSDHATASMALARVIAGEYPRWYVMVPAYGFAETISISRILANQHFPSDVIVGQAIGFFTGTYVLNHRAVSRLSKERMTARLLGSMNPIADARTHTFGASMEIPLRR